MRVLHSSFIMPSTSFAGIIAWSMEDLIEDLSNIHISINDSRIVKGNVYATDKVLGF